MNVSSAVKSRHSVRAFTSQKVTRNQLESILEKARWTPSGGNLQPWWIHVVGGDKLQELMNDVATKLPKSPMGEGGDYNVYPPKLKEPYRTRRYQCGEDLYRSIGIEREDKMGRMHQFANNFRCFGASTAMFFTIDRSMEQGQWSDLGMLIQTIMLLAREEGLHTCAQESWSTWSPTLTRFLNIPEEQMVFCGLAIGYKDEGAAINDWRTQRAPLSEVVSWQGI
ncbi:MAG: nitroreductase [Gammaproteobacteria bacterium]